MSAVQKNKLYPMSLLALSLLLGACDDDGGDGYGDDDPKDSGTSDAGRDAGGGLDASPDATVGTDAASDASKPADASSSTDATVADASTPTDTIPTLNGCAAADYVDQSGSNTVVINFGGQQLGLTYSPKCVTIQVGQTVRFSGDFGDHPLAKGTANDGNAGSPSSPITPSSSSDTMKEFTFNTAGTYPYICTAHRNAGMVGSIHVQ